MKMHRLYKKLLTIIFILALVLNSYAAIVSDNDGSAFVTKAEFDALKNSFSKQINDYNLSIDSKIDGAIASYLAGIKLTTSDILNNYVKSLGATIKFGDIPLVETSKKYKWSINIGANMVSDGYVDIGNSKMGFVQFKGNASGEGPSITVTDNKGQYNWAEKIDGKYYLTKKTTGTYLEHAYVFTGSSYVSLSSGTTLNLATGGGTVSIAWADTFRVNMQKDYNSYAQGIKYFTGKSTNWPGEYGDIWVARSDKFTEGTKTDLQMYSQSFALADDNDKNELVLEEDVIGDHLGELNEVSAVCNGVITLVQSENGYKCKFDGKIACHYPKYERCDLTNVYHYLSHDKVDEDVKLYEGLKLFETNNDGTVSFDIIFTQESTAGNVHFYLREDEKFENTDSNTGSSIEGYYYIAGDATKYEFTDGHIVAPTDKIVKVNINVKKDKKYFVKLVPSTTTEFASMSFMSDLIIKLEV